MEYWYGILLSPSKSEYWYGMLFPLHGLSSWRSPWILGQRPFCAIQRLCPMSSKFQRLPTWSINSGPLKLPGTSWTSELLNHPLLWLFAVPRASSRHRTSLDSCRRPPFFSPKKNPRPNAKAPHPMSSSLPWPREVPAEKSSELLFRGLKFCGDGGIPVFMCFLCVFSFGGGSKRGQGFTRTDGTVDGSRVGAMEEACWEQICNWMHRWFSKMLMLRCFRPIMVRTRKEPDPAQTSFQVV